MSRISYHRDEMIGLKPHHQADSAMVGIEEGLYTLAFTLANSTPTLVFPFMSARCLSHGYAVRTLVLKIVKGE